MSTATKALVKREEPHELLPAVLHAIDRRNVIVQAMKKEVMEDHRDYGVIPGTDKPTLLKPGAEKLCSLFELCVEKPEIVEKEEDWTGERHGGEPFFYYLFCQRLTRNGETVTAQMGSCNSWEKKYRYRNADRVCPHCGQAAILKSSKEPGYFCWKKRGGCGANFRPGDPAIEKQQVGKIKNPDVADQVNAILKMAQKRALVAATLVATNASEFFTQDVEDMEIIDAEYNVREEQPPAKQQSQSNGAKQSPTGADLENMLRQRAGEWERDGLCVAASVFLKLGEWSASHGQELQKIKEWPGPFVVRAIEYLRQLREQLKAPAPQPMLTEIDQLIDKLGWEEAYAEEYLANARLLQPGEIANEHRAQRIILDLQQKLREQEEETSELPASQDSEEVPF